MQRSQDTCWFEMNKQFLRRLFLVLVLGIGASFSSAWSQSELGADHGSKVALAKSTCAPYAGRKMSIVVSSKPGGGFDLMARALNPVLASYSGMRVGVANVTGGAGLQAVRLVFNAKTENPVVGLIYLGSFATQMMEDPKGPSLSSLTGLGVMSTDYSVWVAKKSIPWREKHIDKFMGASSAAALLRLGVPSFAMGLNTQPVFGYQGSTETWLAMLRGEVDVVTMSDQSAKRNLASGAGAMVSLTLTDRPHPDFPGVPYLAGAGGMVDVRTKDMPSVKRKRLMALAFVSAVLSEQDRTLVASAKLDPAILSCLRHATEAALFDSALAEVAKRQKFGLNPADARAAQEKIQQVDQALKDNRQDLLTIAAAWKDAK